MSGHTPGPWIVAKHLACFDGDQVTSVMSSHDLDGGTVVWPSGFRNTDNAKANARLIAAAPALLDVVQALLLAIDGWHITNTSDEDSVGVLADFARAALAAAAGEKA